MNTFYVTKEPGEGGHFQIIRLDQISSAIISLLPKPTINVRLGTEQHRININLDGADFFGIMHSLELEVPVLTSEQIRKINELRSTKTRKQSDQLPDTGIDSIPF